jgi:CDP-diacylglycerol pyrophosphatase
LRSEHIVDLLPPPRGRQAATTPVVGSKCWVPFPVPLADHRYSAIAVNGDDLDAVNPFTLLADGIAGARTDMGLETLVVVGAVGPDGRPGFIVHAGHADASAGDAATGEELQDHTSCSPPPATTL